MSADDSRGLVCAYALDGHGGGRLLDWTGINATHPPAEVRWIHLDFTSEHAQEWIRERSGIPRVIADALLEEDSRPRALQHGDGLLVILRGVNKNPGADPEDMVSIRLWLERNRIVTTRRRSLMSVTSMCEDLVANDGPSSPVGFLRALVEKLGDRIGPVIEQLEDDLEAVESQFASMSKLAYTPEFINLRRQAVRIRRFLVPQRDGLERLSRQQTELMSDADRFELREEADRLTRYLEDLDLVRERAMVAQEELLANYAQEQNSRMYLLAIVAAVFLPLSFLTGLMGMNVAGLPGTENPAAFLLLVLLMIGVAVAILFALKWRRWL